MLLNTINSPNSIADELKPSIICITESKINKYNNCKLPGYSKPIELKRTKKAGGGIWITFKESIKNKVTILELGDDEIEQIWTNIKIGPEDLILGVVYGKQESRVKVEKIKTFMDNIDYYAIKA